jgi:hypothetical protein
MPVSDKRRVIISGSSDAARDVLAARALLVENPLLDDCFEPFAIGMDANFDDLVDKGFRPDDLVVLLLGNRYGDVVSEGKSFEELLFEFAGAANIQRHVFVKSTNFASERQKEFLRLVDSTVVRARYHTTDEVVRSLFVSLCELKFNPTQDEIEDLIEEDGEVPDDTPEAEKSSGWSVPKICGAIAGGAACATGIGFLGALAYAGVGAAIGAFLGSDDDADDDAEASCAAPGDGSEKTSPSDYLDKSADDIHDRIDPKGVGDTFNFNVTFDDLDPQKLEPFVEAENRFLKFANKPPITAMDYLIKRNFATPDGRIYDTALGAFGKIGAPSVTSTPETTGLLLEIKERAELIQTTVKCINKRDLRKNEKHNLKIGTRNLQWIVETWIAEQAKRELYPQAKGRRISKKDVFDRLTKQMQNHQVNSVDDLAKAINNAQVQHPEWFPHKKS